MDIYAKYQMMAVDDIDIEEKDRVDKVIAIYG
jgi:hypothetical protein